MGTLSFVVVLLSSPLPPVTFIVRTENAKMCIRDRRLYDAGGLYNLSNQPSSVMRNNRIEHLIDAPYATKDVYKRQALP